MESHVLSRHFEFHGQKLPDPDPKLSPEEIRNLIVLSRLIVHGCESAHSPAPGNDCRTMTTP